MKEFRGQVKDTLPINNPIGTWQHARNILLTKGSKSIANEDGIKFEYLVDGTIIGVIVTNYHIVYLYKGNDGIDTIGIVNTNDAIPFLTVIVKDNQFNFQLNCPIEGIFIYNYKEELIISWCDGIYENSNSPKVLNLFNLPFDVNPDGTLVTPSDFNKINLSPNLRQGNLDIEYLDNGNLDGYSVYVTLAYVFNDDTRTTFFPASNIAYLGIGANPVDKNGVRLNFTDLDDSFERLRIGIILKSEGTEEVASELLGYESIDLYYINNSLSFDLVSLDAFTSISTEEIVIENAVFDKVNTITKQNKQSLLGNVVISPIFKFQKYANLLNIVPIEYIEEDENNNNKGNQHVSLCPDEVYAFYIELQFLNGTYSPAYHIPGRAAEGTETDALTTQQKTDYDLAWTDAEDNVKQFHIFNNGIARSMPQPTNSVPNTIPTDESGNKMGFWQNVETYPDNDEFDSTVDYNNNSITGGEDLRNTPIRYHRMPSIDSMYENTRDTSDVLITDPNIRRWGLGQSNDIGRTRKLGIKITNIEDIIPVEILNQIQGYRISHIVRNNNNSYVVGNWLGVRRHDYDDPQDAGGDGLGDTDNDYSHYNFGFLNEGVDNPQIRFDKLRILGNELFKFRPSLSPTYLKVNYKSLLQSYIDEDFNVGSTELSNALGFIIADIDRFSKCETPLKYVAGNSPLNNTVYAEEGIDLDAKTDWLGLNLVDGWPGGTSIDTINDNPYTARLMLNLTAFNYSNNLYTGFKSSNLNIVGRTSTIANNTIFKGGDNFTEADININVRGLHRVYKFFEGGGGQQQRLHCSIPIYYNGLNSPINCTELFSPAPADRITLDESILANGIYNFDVYGKESISAIQNILAILTFDINNDYINRFPYRIYRGLSIPTENLSFKSLSTYLANNYYEMPNDKGEIIALRGTKRMLYIQHRYGLFIASIKDTLNTGQDVAYLGSSDLFYREPQEIIPDEKGYTGSTSKFASIVIKGMYITVNQSTGQIFIVTGTSIKEISTIGNKNWFWNNWDIDNEYRYTAYNGEKRRIDNPYISVGHLVAYDKEYNRLLFVKKNYEFKFPELLGETVEIGTVNFDGEFYSENGVLLPFDNEDNFINKSITLSFNLEPNKEMWICPHDYHPNIIFHTFDKLYSITNSFDIIPTTSVYEHNDKFTKGFFYHGITYESYVDLIFNANSNISKILKNVLWISTTKNVNGGIEYFKTITHLMIYNNNQCSGIINLKDNHFELTRNTEGDWEANDFRDLVINPNNPIINDDGELQTDNINTIKLWFEKSNFIGKFIVVRLIMDNIDNDTIYLHEVKTTSIISKR